EWSWPETRDRAQVGIFFGLLGGVVALLVALGYSAISQWVGRVPARASLALHAKYIVMYAMAGLLIGALWPRRRDLLGRWTLSMLAATPISVTFLSIARGAPSGWGARSWLHLAIMIPALTWVIGDRPKPSRPEQSS